MKLATNAVKMIFGMKRTELLPDGVSNTAAKQLPVLNAVSRTRDQLLRRCREV